MLPDCIVRGDFGGVKIGRHCIIGERVVIRPPFKKFQSGVAFFPINIGDYVVIEDDAVINASSIGKTNQKINYSRRNKILTKIYLIKETLCTLEKEQ